LNVVDGDRGEEMVSSSVMEGVGYELAGAQCFLIFARGYLVDDEVLDLEW